MISRTHSHRHLLAALLGVAGFTFAISGASSASAQGDAPPAGSAAPSAAPTTPAPTSTTPAPAASGEDPNKKKAPAAAPASEPTPPAAAPGQMTAAPTSGTTVSFGTGPKKDEPSGAAKAEEKEPPLRRFGGSIFLFDQSFTTNSLSKGSQLSYIPTYEWWLSPRVYYSLTKHFKVGIRQDLFKEWTNSEETTYRSEWRYTDTWLTASYSDKLHFISDKLKGAISFALRPGISKESRGAGQYFSAGPGGSLTYGYDITGEKGKVFKSGTIGVSVSYNHAFTRCSTACDSGFSRPRQNSDGQLVDSDQLRSGALTGNTLLYALNAGLEVADGLSLDASMIFISSFAYHLPDAPVSNSSIPHSDLDTRVRQLSWFLLSLGYDVVKEINVSIGYYNLNNVLRPDGTYRNPLWSPDARAFISVTFNLDEIYQRFSGEKEKKSATARMGGFNF